jgi:hypothetical protein
MNEGWVLKLCRRNPLSPYFNSFVFWGTDYYVMDEHGHCESATVFLTKEDAESWAIGLVLTTPSLTDYVIEAIEVTVTGPVKSDDSLLELS